MDIYTENILEHYQHPHNADTLPRPTVSATAHNPLCGDTLRLDLLIKNAAVADVGFSGSGCAISQAAMSLLTDEIKSKKITQLKKITPAKIYNLLHVTVSPGRIKCALLGLSALQQALKNIKNK